LPENTLFTDAYHNREHPASEVYVTGTFDDWSKTEKLIKTGDVFEKNVTLSSAAEKIYYKVREEGVSFLQNIERREGSIE
jgi:hypothetical protein